MKMAARLHVCMLIPSLEAPKENLHSCLLTDSATYLTLSRLRSAAFSGIERLVDSDLPSVRFPSLLDFLTEVDVVCPHCPTHT
jgi:hypothetical protein